MLEMSERGDNSTVDMLVGDIYGSVGYNALGLKSTTIASSFGKVFRKDGSQREGAEGRKKRFKPEDICKSLLYAISNNIGQIAYMNAEKYGLDRIYFGGCFIRGHKATISTLSYAIRFWSRGTKRAFFLRHEGYLGAIGAWIKHISIADPVHDARSDANGAAVASAGAASSAAQPQPIAVTAVTDTMSAPLISPPGHEALPTPLHGASGAARSIQSVSPSPLPPASSAGLDEASQSHGLPPALAEALGYTTASTNGTLSIAAAAPAQAPLSALSNEHKRSLGVSVPPALSRVASDRANEQQAEQPEEETDDDAGALAAAEVSLDEMIGSLSASEREILAPVLRHLDKLRGTSTASSPALNGSSAGSVAQGQGGDESEASTMAELLARLDAADSAADGLEDKLDMLLEKLDSLLVEDNDAGDQKETRASALPLDR